jgi:hypothetical protein
MRTATVRSDFAPFRNHHHSSPSQSLFPAFGLFSDFPYSNSSSPDNPVSDSKALQPDLLLQALSALTANQQLNAGPQPAHSDSHSLLIELQGNNYVNLTSAEPPPNSPEPTLVPHSLKSSLKKDTSEKPAHELLPVTLLFRDGHSEEVRDYTIANGTIYARGDLCNDGYWNKKIELSTLDLPETIKSNQARGVRFVLPNAPNEVVTRP